MHHQVANPKPPPSTPVHHRWYKSTKILFLSPWWILLNSSHMSTLITTTHIHSHSLDSPSPNPIGLEPKKEKRKKKKNERERERGFCLMGPTKNRKLKQKSYWKWGNQTGISYAFIHWYSVVSFAIQFIFDMKNHNASLNIAYIKFIEHSICRVL